ncbi:MAG: ATP phosphoribosyltransferase regulatory subunit [Polyangiaceae bacterium]|nr:ATP phosphoribosyltransferase regulatory subunit [Polyangiaceae bacterium]MCW5791618.1 ATP phosphoribosyltransferase regulatory subunit [Polyangiaceae bacterium]
MILQGAAVPAASVARGVLRHPLPAGMRDRLPEDARLEAELSRRLLGSFELHGYEQVGVPAFEFAEVLERGLGSFAPGEVLRFVEPESGEVVALRPDMTPQLARLVATRLASAPLPARLSYQGSVLRRPLERARTQRQVLQAGVELVGLSGVEADLEILELAVASVQRAGLSYAVLDLSHAGITGPLLEPLEPERRDEVALALSLKDQSQLEALTEGAPLSAVDRAALRALPQLHGGEALWPRAERLLAGSSAERGVRELHLLWTRARALGVPVLADLGEVRAFRYYSGFLFQLLAEGPGRPLVSGGRYDGLLGRFGESRPAAGMAVDVDRLRLALARTGELPGRGARVLVAPELLALTSALRAARLPCAVGPTDDRAAYAAAWRYTHRLELESAGLVLHPVGSSMGRAGSTGLAGSSVESTIDSSAAAAAVSQSVASTRWAEASEAERVALEVRRLIEAPVGAGPGAEGS